MLVVGIKVFVLSTRSLCLQAEVVHENALFSYINHFTYIRCNNLATVLSNNQNILYRKLHKASPLRWDLFLCRPRGTWSWILSTEHQCVCGIDDNQRLNRPKEFLGFVAIYSSKSKSFAKN